jgi:ATP-dependent RNA helicase RhlE
MGFSIFKFHPRIAAGIQALGFTEPTPIQTKGIPPVLEGRDLLGLAQTGTGKTAAFVLPILERLLAGSHRTLRCLVLAPTRELAEQIHEVIRELTPHTGIRSMTIYGGVGFSPQVDKLRAGHDIIVACPGRLLDHIEKKTVNLSKLEVLVIDEADRMFDMGFLPDIRRVVARLPKNRQTLFYSATMPPEIDRLVREILVDPETVKIGHSAPAVTVEHALYPVSQNLKTPLLLEILKRTTTGSVLIFTRTKHRAKKVARVLGDAGYKAAELQGNLSQNRRQQSLDGFRSGKYRILVATDIAARGIDVSSISHVINYDIPDTTDAYTHRIGRTGRMARLGDAYTFVTHEDEDTIRGIERVMKAKIERRRLDDFDYHASPPREVAPDRGRRPDHGSRPGRGGERRQGQARGSGRAASSRRGDRDDGFVPRKIADAAPGRGEARPKGDARGPGDAPGGRRRSSAPAKRKPFGFGRRRS